MPDIKVDIDIRIVCAECGADIDHLADASTKGSYPAFEVYPCEKCMEAATDEAHSQGYEEGKKDGETDAEAVG